MGVQCDLLYWIKGNKVNFHRTSEAEIAAELEIEEIECIADGLDAGECK